MQSKPDKNQYNELNEGYKLIHDVFVKNEQGAKLLAQWKEILTYRQGYHYGKDPYDLGRVEGEKDFVRGILNAIKQAEGKQ